MLQPATQVRGINTQIATAEFVTLTVALCFIWPDSGLTRNTRAPGYRCSVPGLAGFTGTTLCGARSLITGLKYCRLPIADFQLVLIYRLSIRSK